MDDFIEEDINSDEIAFDKEMTDDEFDSYMDEIMPFIGSMIISFNSLEDSINNCIREIVSNDFASDEIPWIFIAEMSYAAKVRVLEKLYKFRLRWTKKEYTTALSSLISHLNESGRKRNLYVHANWTEVNADKYVKIRTRVRHEGARRIYKVVDTVTFQNDIDYVDNVMDELESFEETFIEE